MMSLLLADLGEENMIKKISGDQVTKKQFETLGFTVGSEIKIISRLGGNIIVNVNETRIAISEEMASKIMI